MSNDVPPLDGPAASSPQMSPAGPMGATPAVEQPNIGIPDPGASASLGAPAGAPANQNAATGTPAAGRGVNSRALIGLVVIVAAVVAFLAGRGNNSDGGDQTDVADTTLAPGTTVSPQDTMPSNMLEVALQFHNEGRLDDAVRAYEAVLRVDPTNKFAFYNIGVIVQGRKEFDKAIENYDKVLALDPNFNPALYNRGLAYRDTDQVDKAIADLEAVVEADPKNASAMWNLGRIYIAEGRTDEGSKLIADALVINPTLEQTEASGSD